MFDDLFRGAPHSAGLQLYHVIFCGLRYDGRYCFFFLQSKLLLITRIYHCGDVIQRIS